MTTIVVYHSMYGYDTGCCGHRVELVGDDGATVDSKFYFDHPYGEDHERYAKDMAADFLRGYFGDAHTADLDWPNCIISED